MRSYGLGWAHPHSHNLTNTPVKFCSCVLHGGNIITWQICQQTDWLVNTCQCIQTQYSYYEDVFRCDAAVQLYLAWLWTVDYFLSRTQGSSLEWIFNSILHCRYCVTVTENQTEIQMHVLIHHVAQLMCWFYTKVNSIWNTLRKWKPVLVYT